MQKSHFIPRLSDFRKCGKRILRSTLWDTERKRAVTLHMCPNKLQEIHHYRVAKSFACFPCHPLNGNRRKFSVRPAERFYTHSVPDAPMRSKVSEGFFFNFGLFCTGCILSQIVKLPSVFPSRRTGQHTNCMKSAVRFLHRKCDFVLLDIDLERFIFQRFLINVKKEFLSLICQLTGTICRKASIFLPKREADRSLWAAQGYAPSAQRPESLPHLRYRAAAIRLPESPLLVQKLRVSFLKQPQIFQTWAKVSAPYRPHQ